MDEYIYVSEDIREVRKFLKIKSYVLSKEAGLSHGYITQIEIGKNRYPRFMELLKVVYVLNRYRRVYGHTFESLRDELRDNLVIDYMEMIERREERISNKGRV